MSNWIWLTLASICGLVCCASRPGDAWLTAIEKHASRLAARKGLVIFAVAITAMLSRIALLWVLPVPTPAIHDEFSYLLAGDTFAHGRLANPPHPMWLFFDTFHVLQHPSYASIYPPAQGAVLALGQLLGQPWIGVLLSMAGMCAAITWMLQGWVPPRWALLGAVLVLSRIHLFSYWLDSYWGGAVAAAGGALVLGALPRIIRHQRSADALALGLGASLLATSRPLEGVLFCIPVTVMLVVWLLSKRSPSLKVTGLRVVLPSLFIVGLTIAFVGYYNRRVTGSSLLFPHVLYNREYANFPLFAWQPLNPPLKYSNPQFEVFYNVWQPTFYYRPWLRLSLSKFRIAWEFFLGPALSIPFLAMPWVLRDRKIRFLLVQFVWCGLGLLSVVWFAPHYAAPLTATLFVLLLQGLRHLRRWEVKARPVGTLLVRLVVVLALARPLVLIGDAIQHPTHAWNFYRAQIVQQLEATPGKHLIVVRYAPKHDTQNEWVYNAADVDHAKIVWARALPGRDPAALLDYFRDRQAWELEPDTLPIKLHPYAVRRTGGTE